MNVEFTTTELITDEEILSAFGESIRFDEGKLESLLLTIVTSREKPIKTSYYS